MNRKRRKSRKLPENLTTVGLGSKSLYFGLNDSVKKSMNQLIDFHRINHSNHKQLINQSKLTKVSSEESLYNL